MLDLYLIHIIGNSVRYYKSSRTVFDPLFPHISSTMRDRLYNTLQNTAVSFDASYNVRTAKRLPLITVECAEQYYDEQGIGQIAGDRLNHIFTSQEATVNIYAETLEAVKLLSMVIHGGMLTFKDMLVQAAYQNFIYVGGSSIMPDPQLRGEDLAVYGMSMRFAGLHLLELPAKVDIDTPNALDPEFTIQVQHETQTPEGSTIKGGVSV